MKKRGRGTSKSVCKKCVINQHVEQLSLCEPVTALSLFLLIINSPFTLWSQREDANLCQVPDSLFLFVRNVSQFHFNSRTPRTGFATFCQVDFYFLVLKLKTCQDKGRESEAKAQLVTEHFLPDAGKVTPSLSPSLLNSLNEAVIL